MARDLPFENGVLSVPQRGEPLLETWKYEDDRAPVRVFEGRSDVVKEFVWRVRESGNTNGSFIISSKNPFLC